MKEFEAICRDYSPVVYRFLLGLCGDANLAEELTAETFYRAFLHIGRFRSDCKPETWLCQIAKNALQKELRRRKKHTSLEAAASLADKSDTIGVLLDRDQARSLREKAQKLPEPYREVFLLRAEGGLKFHEIADVYGKTESWAKVTFYRAKDRLIKEMEDEL